MLGSSPYWSPFRATDDTYEPPKIPIPEGAGLVDLARGLRPDADGFTLGLCVKLMLIQDDDITGSSEVAHGTGKLYLPSDRAEKVGLHTIEQEAPNLTPLLLELGLTTAIRVRNGLISNNPDLIHIVDVS